MVISEDKDKDETIFENKSNRNARGKLLQRITHSACIQGAYLEVKGTHQKDVREVRMIVGAEMVFGA